MQPARPGLLELLTRANESADHVAVRIRNAACAEFELVGIRRSNMIDIARRAGVSRTTLYRRFPDRGSLVEAVTVGEGLGVLGRIAAEVADQPDPAEGVVRIMVVALREMRSHPILRRLRETEPDQLFQVAADSSADVIAVGRQFVLDHLAAWQHAGQLPAGDYAPAAEVMVRLAESLFLTPGGVIPMDDEDEFAEFLRRCLLPMFGLAGVADPV